MKCSMYIITDGRNRNFGVDFLLLFFPFVSKERGLTLYIQL